MPQNNWDVSSGRTCCQCVLPDFCQGGLHMLDSGIQPGFEYSLVQGVNDNLDEAKRLTALLKDMQGHVNLIPVNPIKERDFKQSNRDAIDAFRGYLEKHGINVTIRREMGRDIGGACGQLRKSYLSEEESS